MKTEEDINKLLDECPHLSLEYLRYNEVSKRKVCKLSDGSYHPTLFSAWVHLRGVIQESKRVSHGV